MGQRLCRTGAKPHLLAPTALFFGIPGVPDTSVSVTHPWAERGPFPEPRVVGGEDLWVVSASRGAWGQPQESGTPPWTSGVPSQVLGTPPPLPRPPCAPLTHSRHAGPGRQHGARGGWPQTDSSRWLEAVLWANQLLSLLWEGEEGRPEVPGGSTPLPRSRARHWWKGCPPHQHRTIARPATVTLGAFFLSLSLGKEGLGGGVCVRAPTKHGYLTFVNNSVCRALQQLKDRSPVESGAIKEGFLEEDGTIKGNPGSTHWLRSGSAQRPRFPHLQSGVISSWWAMR